MSDYSQIFPQGSATLHLLWDRVPYYECTSRKDGFVPGQMPLRVPYAQQFSPEQTPLKRLIPILRQNAGKRSALKQAIASAFFSDKTDPVKIAGNTVMSLGTFGIVTRDAGLTEFGQKLIASQGDIPAAHALLARRVLLELDGKGIVDTLQEMADAGLEITLSILPEELKARGYEGSRNSSDLSGVLNWLRAADVLKDYAVNRDRLAELIGVQVASLDALKTLTPELIAFLKAMVCLNVTDWHPYDKILDYAKGLYPGEIRYNEKEIVKTVLNPLKTAGFIDFRKQQKKDASTPEGRGGKPADVFPTNKFQNEVAGPLLEALFRASGFADVRQIRGKSLADIVADVKQTSDPDRSGRALEWLAVRLCQMLDLEFARWRKAEESVVGGGEADALMRSARLVRSRWQIKCQHTSFLVLDDLAKEVGFARFFDSDVVLIVCTGELTRQASTFAEAVREKSRAEICCLGGHDLQTISESPADLPDLILRQAPLALCPTLLC
jgi:hypothetical protein